MRYKSGAPIVAVGNLIKIDKEMSAAAVQNDVNL